MKTCVIIPTYNEEKTIAQLISQTKQLSKDVEIIVVDDGSQDNTYHIAKENGAMALKNDTNEGKGAALIRGFNFALAGGFDAIITMDGDGQHAPSDIPFFLRLARHSESGIFIGNRMSKPKDMPLLRLLTNKFMSWLISKAAGQYIPDTQCGFRLIKRQILEKINLNTCKYETESEILIKVSRLGFKIESVPIKSIYSGEKSRINPFIDSLRFMSYIIKEISTKNIKWITLY